jgi:hypothetical protein
MREYSCLAAFSSSGSAPGDGINEITFANSDNPYVEFLPLGVAVCPNFFGDRQVCGGGIFQAVPHSKMEGGAPARPGSNPEMFAVGYFGRALVSSQRLRELRSDELRHLVDVPDFQH